MSKLPYVQLENRMGRESRIQVVPWMTAGKLTISIENDDDGEDSQVSMFAEEARQLRDVLDQALASLKAPESKEEAA